MTAHEPYVTSATVRDAGDELHIECRFSDGQKFAAVIVAVEFEAQAMMQKAWNRPSPLMTMVHNEAQAAIAAMQEKDHD